ncbi:MAG: redox-sensitive transcriptional activator SoxR [Oceanococcaceae bacterium]
MAELSVGEVARRSGVAVSALHFYESKGLIHSQRNAGNQRRYRREVLRRIALIRAAQAMGVSLAEIARALAVLPNDAAPSAADWRVMSQQWGAQLERRIARLQQMRDSLTGCIGCGCLSMDVCPLYNPDDQLAHAGPGPVILNRK